MGLLGHIPGELVVLAALAALPFFDLTLSVAPWVNTFILGVFSGMLALLAGVGLVVFRLVGSRRPQSPKPAAGPPTPPADHPPVPLVCFHPGVGDSVRENLHEGSAAWVNVVLSYALSSLDLPAWCDNAVESALADANFLTDVKVLACDLNYHRHPSVVDYVRVWTSTLSPSPSPSGSRQDTPPTTPRSSAPSSLPLSPRVAGARAGARRVLRGEVGVDVSLDGRLHVQGDLVVNHPVPNLCALPVRILIANVRVRGDLLFGLDLAGGCVEVAFAQPPKVDFDLVVEMGVGFALRDTGKLGGVVRWLLVDQLNKLLVQPNKHTLHFQPPTPAQ